MGGRALNDWGYLGCGDPPCVGLSRLHHETAVELAFIEEQQALARAAILGLDLPRDGAGPGLAHLQDAVGRCVRDTQCQGARALLRYPIVR